MLISETWLIVTRILAKLDHLLNILMTFQSDKSISISNVQHSKIYMDSMDSWPGENVACKYYKLHTEWRLADVSIVL